MKERRSPPLGMPAEPTKRRTSQFTAYLSVAGAIKVVDIIGIEDKGAPTSVGPLYSNTGVAVQM